MTILPDSTALLEETNERNHKSLQSLQKVVCNAMHSTHIHVYVTSSLAWDKKDCMCNFEENSYIPEGSFGTLD